MLKRVIVAFTFVAAVIAAGVGAANQAEAHGYRHGCHRGHGGGHYGHRTAYVTIDYGYYSTHRTYFGPRYPYSPAFDRPYYGHGGYGGNRVSFSIGY